jgi:anaerobic selenocysteine-containing dehydrogenase
VTTLPSVCPLDCPDTCSLTIHVRDGVVTKVGRSRANPFTGGKICSKVTRGLPELVHGPARLTTPLRRTGKRGEGAYEPTSWDSAIDEIHDRYCEIIDKYGAQAILPLSLDRSPDRSGRIWVPPGRRLASGCRRTRRCVPPHAAFCRPESATY